MSSWADRRDAAIRHWECGRLGEAAMLFREAAGSADADVVPNLAIVLDELGDVSGAIAACEEALTVGDDETAARAAHNLGCFLAAKGDLVAARQAFERA